MYVAGYTNLECSVLECEIPVGADPTDIFSVRFVYSDRKKSGGFSAEPHCGLCTVLP